MVSIGEHALLRVFMGGEGPGSVMFKAFLLVEKERRHFKTIFVGREERADGVIYLALQYAFYIIRQRLA